MLTELMPCQQCLCAGRQSDVLSVSGIQYKLAFWLSLVRDHLDNKLK